MKTTRVLLSVLVGFVLLLSACSSQATVSPTTAAPAAPATQAPAATESPAAVPVTGAATVNVEKNDQLGSFLVDEKNMTLYLFTKDTPDRKSVV